jgi:glyoxylase-like metal-dependent hydrolase (beta-lactamase superfamily II)/rhodanese-related sulfurtransferase
MDPTLDVVTLETPWLGNHSYVVLDMAHDLAIAVDPPRDVDRVERIVDERHARLALVVETHRHADYVSGGLQLARSHGAVYGVPPGAPEPAFDYEPVVDGTTLAAGSLLLRAVSTPGHTAHHVAYVLEYDGVVHAVFTGGSLLHGAVGRTDLVDAGATRSLAELQWQSARRLSTLPAETAVLPTHGFGSFCSAAPVSRSGTSTVGEECQTNAALTSACTEFVGTLLAGYDAVPAYYARTPALNAAGPPPIDLSLPRQLDASELLARIDAGEWVVDLRARRTFAAGHVPGTLSFDAGGNTGVYLAWMLPPGAEVTLLGDDTEQVCRVRRQLAIVGVDRVAGTALGRPVDWIGPQIETRAYPVSGFAAVTSERADPGIRVLDVRNRAEWDCSHIEGATHIPVPELIDRIDELPPPGRAELWVHCQTGFRGAIAASILEQAGHAVVLVDEPFGAAAEAGLPIHACQNGACVPGSSGMRTPTSRAVSRAMS